MVLSFCWQLNAINRHVKFVLSEIIFCYNLVELLDNEGTNMCSVN